MGKTRPPATTEAEWRRRLLEAHPDRGGDHDTFAKLSADRDAWRETQPRICQWKECRKPFQPRVYPDGTLQKYCGLFCARRAKAAHDRNVRRLK